MASHEDRQWDGGDNDDGCSGGGCSCGFVALLFDNLNGRLWNLFLKFPCGGELFDITTTMRLSAMELKKGVQEISMFET